MVNSLFKVGDRVKLASRFSGTGSDAIERVKCSVGTIEELEENGHAWIVQFDNLPMGQHWSLEDDDIELAEGPW